MAAQLKLETLTVIQRERLVGVFHHSDPETACQIAMALAEGGLSILEFTNRSSHALASFEEVEKSVRRRFPHVVIGAGSIIDASTASAYMNRGANFLVGPSLSAEVAKVAARRQIPYMPGCASITEMLAANELGCEVVKIFPAGSVGGPGFIKAARQPCPWLQIMPTGGVTADPDDIQRWIDAGAFAVGLGGSLVDPDLVKAGRWNELADKARVLSESLTDTCVRSVQTVVL